MKTNNKHHLRIPVPEIRTGKARRFMNLLFITIMACSIVVAGSGCKSSKAAAAAKAKAAAEAQARADAEAKRKADADAAKQKADADAKAAAAKEPYDRVEKYFQMVSTASSVGIANTTIDNALKSFTSADVPVLIIIYKSGATVDYDQPTTISKYLAYVKDQKKSPNKVDHLEMDSNGKITEVVLMKK